MATSALRSAAAAAAGSANSAVAAVAALRRLPPRGSFYSSSSGRHDDAREAEKWEKITYAGIITCTILAIYNLRKGHGHYPDPPPYPYLHIRNKEFPWGPDGLFERKKQHSDH